MSAAILDFERFARDAKVRVFVSAIDAYNETQRNTYTAADVARAAPTWTLAMWTMLTAFASQLEGRRIAFPSPITQAEVIAAYEDRARKSVVARALLAQAAVSR